MKNRIFETTGILSQFRSILFDCDGLWQRFDCEDAARNAGLQVISVSDEMDLRYEYENALINRSEQSILFVVTQQEIYIPNDIKRACYVTRLTLESIFPQLSANVLRTLPGIDFDLLAASLAHAPFGAMDDEHTRQWCSTEMYRAENCRNYASALLNQAKALSASASGHRDWGVIATLYGKAAMFHHSGVTLENWIDYRRDIEESFAAWIEQKYRMLSGSVDRHRPVILSKVADYIRRSRSKVALIVMDGMSFENLYTIQRELTTHSISFDIDSTFSFFPTVTAVARQSIFSGKLPSEHPKPFSLDNEEKQWFAFWENAGLRSNEIVFHKGLIGDVPFSAKAVGIIVNIVDDLMHSELQGLAGIQHGLRAWTKNGQLVKMFQMLLDNGFVVYMTSDHGNTSSTAKGRFMKPSVLAEHASRRAVIYDASFDARELDKFDVMRYSGAYLPNGYDAYLFSADTCYGDTGKEYITHGGMTLEEAVVPFVRIGG